MGILEWFSMPFSGGLPSLGVEPRSTPLQVNYLPSEPPVGKESDCNGGRPRFNPWVGKIPWRNKWQPMSAFLLENPHGQRKLVGYSPRSHKESDTTERLTLSLSFLVLNNVESQYCISVSSQHESFVLSRRSVFFLVYIMIERLRAQTLASHCLGLNLGCNTY